MLAALGVDASTPHAVREALSQHELDSSRRLLPPTIILRAESAQTTLPALPDGTVLRVDTECGETHDWGPGARLPLGAHSTPSRGERERFDKRAERA